MSARKIGDPICVAPTGDVCREGASGTSSIETAGWPEKQFRAFGTGPAEPAERR